MAEISYLGLTEAQYLALTEPEYLALVEALSEDDPFVFTDDSPAYVYAKMLEDLGQGTQGTLETSWSIYVNHKPDHPDNVIVCYDIAGQTDGRLMGLGWEVQHPGIALHVRGDAPQKTYQKMANILALTSQTTQQNVVVGTNTYLVHAVTRVTGVLNLPPTPGDRRQQFTVTLLATITQ